MKDNDRIKALENYVEEDKINKGIKEGIRIKCLWLQTSILTWAVASGVFIVNHWDRAMAVVIAMLKALHDSSKS